MTFDAPRPAPLPAPVVALADGQWHRMHPATPLLRGDDLVVRRGIAWLRFVAVPYGRMQLVDISRGPVSRVLGLSELRLVTASASSDVEVPGLPLEVAETLRDRLVGLAETRRGGL